MFFNAQMAFNRDVSVMFLRAVDVRGPALDAMAATGARGLRLAKEVGGIDMVINDREAEAHSFILEGIRENGLEARAENRDMRCLLAEENFGYVDLDPFGSPVPFIHAAIGGCRRNGILAITATDTAPLAGAQRAKCERRYGARPLHESPGHEAGTRILLGHLVRQLAQYDRGLEPLLCYYADHYIRLYVRITEGAARADGSLAKLSMLHRDRSGFHFSPEGNHGPMWSGPLMDPDLLSAMEADESLAEPRRCLKALSTWRQELQLPMFLEVNELASEAGTSPPPMEVMLAMLNEVGRASRTHFSPTGIKTDVERDEVVDMLRSL